MAALRALLACAALAASTASLDDGLSLLQTRAQLKPKRGRGPGRNGTSLGQLLKAVLRSPGEQMVLRRMAAAPQDAAVQADGCRSLEDLILLKRTRLATPAVIEPIAEAVQRHVANRSTVRACMTALSAFRPVFDRPQTLAVNNGTHIANAVAAVVRFYPHDREMQKDFLMAVASFDTFVACEVQPPFVQAGCLDLVWHALDNFPGRSNSDVQMSAWQAFSDHSACPYSATVIADHGGHNVGVQRIVQALREAVGNQFHPDEMHGGDAINLQYEIMTVGNGLLLHANASNGRFDAFVRAGYGQAVLDSMRDQPLERSTNDRACTALSVLTESATVREDLEKAGALELMVAAMGRFKDRDHSVFVNAEVGDTHPVLPSCDAALRKFAMASTSSQDALLRLDVLEVYRTMRQDLQWKFPEMRELPQLLLQGQAES